MINVLVNAYFVIGFAAVCLSKFRKLARVTTVAARVALALALLLAILIRPLSKSVMAIPDAILFFGPWIVIAFLAPSRKHLTARFL